MEDALICRREAAAWTAAGVEQPQAAGTIAIRHATEVRCVRATLVAAAMGLAALVAGCAPVEDPSAGMPVAEAIKLIDRAPRSERTPGELAEAFALNSRSTEVQRDALRDEVVGCSVAWEVPVYEVGYADGRYTVTSQPIPVRDTGAVPLLRVQAFVLPRSEDDHALLRKVETGDFIRLQGVVREIRLRAVVTIVPAVVVRGAAGAGP